MRLIFDRFEIDPEGCQLFRDGVEVRLERRALDLLCYLARNPQRLILRDELLDQVWQARSLSEGVLANTIAKLRKALGQAADAQEPIETVRGRGYRWRLLPRDAPRPGPDAAPDSLDPFVGRARPLEQLSSALERAARETGQLIIVAGEAGVGKTRLVRELAKIAQVRGFAVWGGAAYDGGATPAYWTWVEMLRSAHEQLQAEAWQRHLPRVHSALAELVPELCEKSARTSVDLQTLRFKVFDELTCFLKSASRESPLLVVLEDLHWADAGTIELLAHAARALQRHAVLLLATMRDRDVAFGDARAAALRRAERLTRRLSLKGLTKAEVMELVSALEGSSGFDAELVDVLWERTRGNPLFVRQWFELLTQPGPLSQLDARQFPPEMPPATRSVIEQRIGLLPPASAEVLSAGAVAGMEFDATLIGQVLERSPEAVLAAIEPALQLRVLEREATMPPQRFAFAHCLFRDAIYERLGVTAAGNLHAQFVRALSARGAAQDPRVVGDLARHSLLAVPCELEASVAYCSAAAAAARARSGFEAAAELLQRLILTHESEGGSLRERGELLLLLGFDQSYAGAFPAAWQTLRRGAELAQLLRDPALLARFALRLARYLEFGGGDETFARAMLDQALGTLGADETDLRAGLLASRAELEDELPFAERSALLDEADALAERRATPSLLRHLAFARVVMPGPLRIAERREAVQRFRALDAKDRGTHADPVRGYHAFYVELNEHSLALTACDRSAAAAALARCRAVAQGANVMALDFLVALADAGCALGEGRLSDLETNVQRLRESADGGGLFGLAWLFYSARLAHARGQLAVLAQGLVALPPSFSEVPGHMRVPMAIYRAWMSAQGGRHDDASHVLADAPVGELARMPARRGDIGVLCALAETYHLLGNVAGAAWLLPQLEPWGQLNAIGSTFEPYGAVSHYLGLLAALLGRAADAAAYFDRAIELNRALRMPLELARSEAQRAACSR